ncbi:MAG: hypothetical protein ABSA53_10285 [Streptosporangiaceae bacterium]|jgi:hypothetical protein
MELRVIRPARSWSGVVVAVLLLLVLAGVATRSSRREAARPPYHSGAERIRRRRMVTAAALTAGLADDQFWDGEGSARLLTAVHVAVAAGFLAIVVGVTATDLTATGSAHVIVLGRLAIGLGAATIALGVAYICLDAWSTPILSPHPRRPRGALADLLRRRLVYLPGPAAAALIAAGVFAWLQPGRAAGRPAELPGMAAVIGWTTLAVAVPVVAAFVSMLLGAARGGRPAFFGGPWVTLVLAFSLLNTVMLGAGIAAAHIAGPVTSNAAAAVSPAHRMIYVPYLITAGVPLAALAAMIAGATFTVAELTRRLRWRDHAQRTLTIFWDVATFWRGPITRSRRLARPNARCRSFRSGWGC